jgi:hypothetical protein
VQAESSARRIHEYAQTHASVNRTDYIAASAFTEAMGKIKAERNS